MARTLRDGKLDTRNARLKLKRRREPYWRSLSIGMAIGYRRGVAGGTWIARRYTPESGLQYHALGAADDVADADGHQVLSFAQAQEAARGWFADKASGDDGEERRRGPYTVRAALDDYESDLKTRGADAANVHRARAHVPAELSARAVRSLTSAELRRWRDRLAKSMAPASVNRTLTCLKAALNLAAEKNDHIAREPWENGLKAIPDAERSRNVVVSDALTRRLVSECSAPDRRAEPIKDPEARAKAETEAQRWADAFGLFVEVLAVTGARASQAARIEVRDVQSDRSDPRLMMPTSKKGKGTKRIDRRPVPIPAALALRLRAAASKRPAADKLLLKPTGEPWQKSDHNRPFERAVARLRTKLADEATRRNADADEIAKAGDELDDVTIYALRHSSIVRQLLAGVPIRVVAVNHDTSVSMIEQNYSRFISDHTDTLARKALLDLSEPGSNVVTIGALGR